MLLQLFMQLHILVSKAKKKKTPFIFPFHQLIQNRFFYRKINVRLHYFFKKIFSLTTVFFLIYQLQTASESFILSNNLLALRIKTLDSNHTLLKLFKS
jgi:hypothetical protein